MGLCASVASGLRLMAEHTDAQRTHRTQVRAFVGTTCTFRNCQKQSCIASITLWKRMSLVPELVKVNQPYGQMHSTRIAQFPFEWNGMLSREHVIVTPSSLHCSLLHNINNCNLLAMSATRLAAEWGILFLEHPIRGEDDSFLVNTRKIKYDRVSYVEFKFG